MRAPLAVYRAVVIPERDDSMSLSVATEVIRRGQPLVAVLMGQAQQVVMIKNHGLSQRAEFKDKLGRSCQLSILPGSRSHRLSRPAAVDPKWIELH